VLKDARLLHQLLRHEGRDGDHRKAAVVQLLGLQLLELLGVSGLQAQGVEAAQKCTTRINVILSLIMRLKRF
jgi:hypothetical protein